MKLKNPQLTLWAISYVMHFNLVFKIDCVRLQRALNISHNPDCTALSQHLQSIL